MADTLVDKGNGGDINASRSSSSHQVYTISPSKILNLNVKNLRVFNDKIQIIFIKCESLREAEKLLKNVKHQNFPNAFIVCVEVKNQEKSLIENVKNLVSQKFPNRPFLLQINRKNFICERNANFKGIHLNTNDNENTLNLMKEKLTTKIFLNAQKDFSINNADFKRLQLMLKQGKSKKFEVKNFLKKALSKVSEEQKVFNKVSEYLGFKIKFETESSRNLPLDLSKNPEIIFQYAINARDGLCLRLLNLFDLNFTKEVQEKIFLSVIESKSKEVFLAFFNIFEETELTNKKVERISASENLFDNFLLHAVQCNYLDAVKFLLNLNLTFSALNEALKTAIDREYFEIFDLLKNSSFSARNKDFDELIKKGDAILEEIEKLHENIKNGNIDGVKKFSEENPNYKLCYGNQKICALNYSLECDQLKVYLLLRAEGFYSDKGSELKDAIAKLSEAQKDIIRKEVSKYVQEFSENFEKVEKDEAQIEGNEEYINEIDKLHENIQAGNFEGVKEFVINFKDERLCCSRKKISALEYAIDCKQFKIFSFLRANNFYTERVSELAKKIESLDDDEKEEIRVQNLRFFRGFPDAFIGILLSKCKFDATCPVSSSEVREMLIELSQVPELRVFLQIAAQADFKIIFDFHSESIKKLVPGHDYDMMGLVAFREKVLYVGRDQDKHLRYGTFMKELTHMVLYLVYENNCLPYCEKDIKRAEEWEEIVQHTRNYVRHWCDNVEPIIRWVFECYNEGYEQLVELAVRPNQIMAQYIKDPERVQELREVHAEVFVYMQNFVIPDLYIPNILRIKELNNKFEVIEKCVSSNLKLKPLAILEIINQQNEKIVLTSNVPRLALIKIFNDIEIFSPNKLDVKVKNVFVDVERLSVYKQELLDLIEQSMIDRVIFDATMILGEVNIKNLIKFIDLVPNEISTIIVCSEEAAKSFTHNKYHKNFSMEDLIGESQAKILKTKINYGGKLFKASKIVDSISDEMFTRICNEQDISINLNREQKISESFIPRTIINSSGYEFDLRNFLEIIRGERVVLISDLPGNGKTTLLIKINERLNEVYPEYWISYVPLIDHVDDLLSIDIESFEEIICKILKINQIEQKVFFTNFQRVKLNFSLTGLTNFPQTAEIKL